jgi:uncharacterized protein (DUF2252 family)
MNENDVVARIAAYNRDCDPKLLHYKYERMAVNAFAFFRGTCHLFYEDWPAKTTLDDAPVAWLCGDLHLENFGCYKGDNRQVYFDINDFDEAALAPVSCDLTRLVASVTLAADAYRSADEKLHGLEAATIAAYAKALETGKERWIERETASGMIGDLLRHARNRDRKSFLDKRTVVEDGRRRLAIIPGKTAGLGKAERKLAVEIVRQIPGQSAGFLEPLDVKRRIAGTGSLGLPRYVVLVEGRGSPDGNHLIDVKWARPPAIESRRGGSQPAWGSTAERVVTLQRRLQAVAPALLHHVTTDGGSWTVRELQPMEDALDLARAGPTADALQFFVTCCAELTAWAHLRGSGRQGSATADELIGFAGKSKWIGRVLDYANEYAEKARQDWQSFVEALHDRRVPHGGKKAA